MLPNMSGTAEEYCYSLQVTFRIATVFLCEAAARNGPGNHPHLPTSLKLPFIHALSIWGLVWSLPRPVKEKEEMRRMFSWELHFGMSQYLRTIKAPHKIYLDFKWLLKWEGRAIIGLSIYKDKQQCSLWCMYQMDMVLSLSLSIYLASSIHLSPVISIIIKMPVSISTWVSCFLTFTFLSLPPRLHSLPVLPEDSDFSLCLQCL